MTATILTAEAAKAAKLNLIEDPTKGMQALHETVVAYQAARRLGTACTKTKGEVSGSGSKPYRQKGTGRARAGYIRSPIRRGGGVVFGPKPRSYRKKVNDQVRRLALRKAISAQILDGNIFLVEDFNVDTPKTKAFLAAVGHITDAAKILIVSGNFQPHTYLAGRNVGHVRLMRDLDVNAEDLLRYRKVVITRDAFDVLVRRTVQQKRRADAGLAEEVRTVAAA